MTRKHYKVIAEALRKSKPYDARAQETWSDIVAMMTEELNSNYANFNKDLFLKACDIFKNEVQ